MITRAPFLKTRYGGYLHRDVPDEDTELTHVGPHTPCGEYLRRFWQPICFSDELRDLPHRIKILGEELVVFRDRSGAVGLLEMHCPHRGASLEYGQIDTKGIRCCYHGWLFAADGATHNLSFQVSEIALLSGVGTRQLVYFLLGCHDDPLLAQQKLRQSCAPGQK